jgi:hypothetical protein
MGLVGGFALVVIAAVGVARLRSRSEHPLALSSRRLVPAYGPILLALYDGDAGQGRGHNGQQPSWLSLCAIAVTYGRLSTVESKQ